MSNHERPTHFTETYFKYLLQQYGVKCLIFQMEIEKYNSHVGGVFFKKDKLEPCNFRLNESRYKLLNEVYIHKVQMETVYPNNRTNEVIVHAETFYMADLCSMINQGQIDVYMEDPDGVLVEIFVSNKEIVSLLDENKESFFNKLFGFLFPKRLS